MINELSFGQKVDKENGLIMPWVTHGALDVISSMDLTDKIVWMWGAGMGDAWLAKRCKKLYVVERNEEWLDKASGLCAYNGVYNIEYLRRPCNEGSGAQEMYCNILEFIHPEVFIVDDAYRYECILKAIEYRPCTLIVDNWQQSYVFMCPSAEEALKDFESQIFEQADHLDNDGINKWKTGIWNIK